MYIMYGAPFSAYTGKARSYLIKQGIPFEERVYGHPRFSQVIMPATHRHLIPQMEMPDGAIVQDTSDIIDYFYSGGMELFPSRPKGAVARAVSHLFELFGGEGMMRPGMYYRWFFDEANLTFLEEQFGTSAAPTLSSEQRLAVARGQMGRMRKAAGALGVTEELGPMIEEGYLEFLDALNAHLLQHPYLVGSTPTIGDYGMQVMFYAHLARDPYPAAVMKNRTQAVYRWTERMHHPGRCTPEYVDYPDEFIADDNVPETLKTLMRLIAQDYLPELEASIATHNAWLVVNPTPEGALVGGKKMNRAVGFCDFQVRGMKVSCWARTYPIYILQRLQDWFDGLDSAEKAPVLALFEETNCLPFLKWRCRRRVERHDNKEVWGGPSKPLVR